jgi:hypothetical protein
MLSDTKILLKEAAEREQLLLQEREDLKQKVSHSCLTPHEQFFSYILSWHSIHSKIFSIFSPLLLKQNSIQ